MVRSQQLACGCSTPCTGWCARAGPLLAPPVTVDGLDIAVRYLPGPQVGGLGGDWYETVAIGDNALVAVVGDVAGHGAGAAADMIELRSLIGNLVRSGWPLQRLFGLVHESIAPDRSLYATAQVFLLDPVRQRLSYCNAGHPWALLRDPAGRVHRLDDARHPPIGVLAGPDALARVDFRPGSLLLAYTDGLVERTAHSIVARIDRLAEILATVNPAAELEDLLDQVVALARRPDEDGEPLDDDVTAMLIRGRVG